MSDIDKAKFEESHGNLGVKPKAPMDKNPSSNPGIVYEPANKPTNPGALKVSRQTSENIVWKAKDGGTVSIGTLLTSPVTTAGSAGIEILDKKGDQLVVISDEDAAILTIQNSPSADTPFGPVSIVNNSAQASEALALESTHTIATHFNLILFLDNDPGATGYSVYTSDGTTPNGNLSGSVGDICLGGPSGQPFYCTGTTNWTGF